MLDKQTPDIITKVEDAVAYCRVSTTEQVQGYSLDVQERECIEYAERNNYRLVRIFREEGESAKTLRRTELSKMIEYISTRRNSIKAVIIYKIDRITRDHIDYLTLRELLKRLSIELKSVTEPIDGTPHGKFISTVLSGAAELDNDMRAIKTISGMRQAMMEGRWVGPPMVGYKTKIGLSGKSNLVIDEAVAPYIRKAFILCGSGKYKLTEIVEILKEEGFEEIYKQKLSKILRKPIYYGRMTHGVLDHPVQGSFEPIISESDFIKAQEVLDGKKKNTRVRNRDNPDFPLRGFLICPFCEKQITGSKSRSRSGKYYSYYHCNTSKCRLKNIPKEKVEDDFVEMLKRMKPDDRTMQLFFDILEERYEEMSKEKARRENKLRAELAQLKEKKARIEDMYIDQKIEREIFEEHRSKTGSEIIVREIELENISEELVKDLSGSLKYCEYFMRNIDQIWINGDIRTRKRFQNILFPEGIYYDGNEFIGTDKKSCIFQLLGAETRRTSTLAPREGLEPPT
ncbi:MAG: recombinase family protein [Actinobacteria bacterium]|nr:recombinase family protein [Actinomycetota bacterium]